MWYDTDEWRGMLSAYDQANQRIILLSAESLYKTGAADGYMTPSGQPNKKARSVGEILNELGGLSLMQFVGHQVTERLQVDGKGVARELEHCWDRIGDWLA